MTGTRILSAAFVLALSSMPAFADPVKIIDGDGLEIAGTQIRLWGIDAPEYDQTCERFSVTFSCGQVAREVLRGIVGDARPECETINQDRYGRTVATCEISGRDLGAEMVRSGWALDFTRYSGGAYQPQQDAAQSDASGLWAGELVPPWDWRN